MKDRITLKVLATLPNMLTEDGELNEDNWFVRVQFNDPEHYSRARMKDYAQWHTLMFICEENGVQTAYAKGFGSTIAVTDNDDVTWRVFSRCDIGEILYDY